MNKYKKLQELSKHIFSTKNVILSEIKGKKNLILDVGCNEGFFGKHDTEKSNIYYGLDIDFESLEEAKKYYKEVDFYNLNDLKELKFGNIKFDYILFADVLEHIINPKETIEFFCNKYLKENGKIIISLPNIANWQTRFGLLFGNFDYTDIGILDNTHLKLYTYKSSRKLINDSGLDLKKELFGATFFGYIIKILPFTRNLLSTNIITVSQKK